MVKVLVTRTSLGVGLVPSTISFLLVRVTIDLSAASILARTVVSTWPCLKPVVSIPRCLRLVCSVLLCRNSIRVPVLCEWSY